MNGVNRVESKEVQELLAELIGVTGWSQAEVGRQVGVHESTVCCWLSGVRTPKPPTVKWLRMMLSEAKEDNRKQPA